MSVNNAQVQPRAGDWGADRFPLTPGRDFFINKNKNGELVFRFRRELLNGLERICITFVLEGYGHDCYLTVNKHIKHNKRFSVIKLSADLTEALFKNKKLSALWLVNEFNRFELYMFLSL